MHWTQIKRKLNVCGMAGSTPAQLSKAIHRKDSSVFTATPISRLGSAMSEIGANTIQSSGVLKKNLYKMPLGTATTKLALVKSTWVNNSNGPSSVPSLTPRGSIGPPLSKPRPSIDTQSTVLTVESSLWLQFLFVQLNLNRPWPAQQSHYSYNHSSRTAHSCVP